MTHHDLFARVRILGCGMLMAFCCQISHAADSPDSAPPHQIAINESTSKESVRTAEPFDAAVVDQMAVYQGLTANSSSKSNLRFRASAAAQEDEKAITDCRAGLPGFMRGSAAMLLLACALLYSRSSAPRQ